MNWDRILELDEQYSRWIRVAERPGILRTIAIFLAHSGDSWFWVIGLGLLWYWGTKFWKLWAVSLFIGILATALVVLLIKLTVRRRRPEGEWGGIYRNTDPHSFPSGHAARGVMLAVIAASLGPAWLAAVLLVWAPLVALARVVMGLHYLTDILAGCGIGLVIGVVEALILR